MSLCQLPALLTERLGRPVDFILLPECRFREKIQRDREPWTLRDYDLNLRPDRLSEFVAIATRVAGDLPAWCRDFERKVRAEQGWGG